VLSSAFLASNRRPQGYDAFAAEARHLISSARTCNPSGGSRSVELYWSMGRLVTSYQRRHGWKGGVLQMLSEDLRDWFPGVAGLSCRNLQYMRAFAAAWPEGPKSGAGIAALPWGHITVLLDKVPDAGRRNKLVEQALGNRWSRVQLQVRTLGEQDLPSSGEAGIHSGDGEDLVHQE
jgi:hypothetical protein